MRSVIRRLGGGLALVFMLNGFFAAALPVQASASESVPEHGMMHHGMGMGGMGGMAHTAEHRPSHDMPTHCHDDAPCCTGGQICSCAYLSELPLAIAGNVSSALAPLSLDTAAMVSRPQQPPLRPPRA